jgi:hypothetical protein
LIESAHDYLGRPLGQRLPETLSRTPVFVLVPKGGLSTLSLDPPLAGSAFREGSTCPVVLRLEMPQAATDLDQQAHKLPPGAQADLRISAYNLSDRPARGMVRVTGGAPWKLTPARYDVTLAPGERTSLVIQVQAEHGVERPRPADIKLEGDFGAAGRSVLAFRLTAP